MMLTHPTCFRDAATLLAAYSQQFQSFLHHLKALFGETRFYAARQTSSVNLSASSTCFMFSTSTVLQASENLTRLLDANFAPGR